MALKVGLQAVDGGGVERRTGALARAYTKIDEAYQTLGMRDEAVHEEKALEIFEELGDLTNVTTLAINLGVQAYADGRWDDAISLYAKAQEVSRRSGNIPAESRRRGKSRRSPDQPGATGRGRDGASGGETGTCGGRR